MKIKLYADFSTQGNIEAFNLPLHIDSFMLRCIPTSIIEIIINGQKIISATYDDLLEAHNNMLSLKGGFRVDIIEFKLKDLTSYDGIKIDDLRIEVKGAGKIFIKER